LAPSKANATVLKKLQSAIEFIDPGQISEATAGVSLEAGILCGLLFRLGGFQVGQEVAALSDATIFLYALEQRLTVLTRNYDDFDRMNRIMPGGKVLFYKPV
jgi:predicted nucleic acid-binding protein